MPPHLNEIKGPCSERGRFKLELLTEGYPSGRDVRNIIKVLELTATWLDADERNEPASSLDQTAAGLEAAGTMKTSSLPPSPPGE